ncbi:hypothetical protein GCK72_026213 [Caenorhabditis remanei]|uniref:Uncharacterized protein n=1 Tax=Caenorhabditis remanei TaxID=31234 RepID=A0A6A5G575_CAERE|nr:hypothetical protein GCK72_026213 [Caenorhabditis remanei]KAF1749744.1 hypothetical protein GCK72_026213 [Caenorhabditis remanei]
MDTAVLITYEIATIFYLTLKPECGAKMDSVRVVRGFETALYTLEVNIAEAETPTASSSQAPTFPSST